MGPTATGKTDAAAALYDQFDAEIISVDSSLVYRGMNIGTAKPESAFLARYPHHLIDVRTPNEPYSAADFVTDVQSLLASCVERGKLPILVGGTFFYFNALMSGLAPLPTADQELRAKLSAQAESEGWPTLHAQLSDLDPVSAARIDPNDAQRIQRALEINLVTGNVVPQAPISAESPYQWIKLGLCFSDRQRLHQRIALRFERMIERGLLQEIEGLLSDGVDVQTPAMKMIGYRQMLPYLDSQCSLEEAKEQGVIATRQLAKRQLTWMRNQANLVWWVDEGLENQDFEALNQFVAGYFR